MPIGLENGKMVFDKTSVKNYTKPLYLKTHVNGKALGRVLVDNGLAMNAIPLKTLITLGKMEDDIIAIDLMVINVNGEAVSVLTCIPL